MTRELPLGELRLRALAYAISATLAAGTAANVGAQEAPASQPNGLEEITVTGTRIQHEDYVSPNPVNTFDAAKMQSLGLVNVADVITQIPSNISQFQAANTGGSAFFIGSTLANLRGLNPFFGTRTLTLVDSRRFIATTQGDSVDLNFIPSIMIDRTEVVTGGASAAYGSGAISGVVNILLDRRLEGIKLDLDMGSTGAGDGDNYHVGMAGGSAFGNGRGHFVAGGEYQQQDVIQSCSDARDWCGAGRGIFNNNTGFSFSAGDPYMAKIPGQPANIIVSNLRQNQGSHTGVIFNNTPGATSTTQLNSAGTGVVPFAIGAEGWRTTGGQVVGGDGESTYKNLSLYPDVERKTFYGHVSWDFSDTLTGFAEVSYGNVVGINHQWGGGQNTAYACVQQDNPFVTPAVRTALNARFNNAPFATFPNQICGDFTGGFLPFLNATVITKDWSDQNDQTVTTDTDVTRYVLGLNGELGSNWSWEAYWQNGKTNRDQIGIGYRTNWRYDMAIDAVLDTRPGSPTLNQPICRVTLTGVLPGPPGVVDPSLAQGCAPLNPFGNASASAAALRYAFGPLTEHDDITQNVMAGTFSGQLWKGFAAGPLMGAFGAEYRKDELRNLAGNLPRAQRTDFGLQYGDSFLGKTEVSEAFMEFEMPFLKDKPGAQLLTMNYAVRGAEYKNTDMGPSGQQGTQSITTWKLAGVYDPVDWMRVRASRSRDLRAASFRELYYSQSIPPGGFFGSTNNPWIPPNPANPQAQSDATWLILAGNPALKPEVSDTNTYGLVFSPSGWAEGMHLSVDYYEINIKDGQALGFAGEVVRQCFEENNATQCGRIKFGAPTIPGNPRSNIEELYDPYINQAPYLSTGVDLSWDYLLALDASSLAFNVTATHMIDTIIQSGTQKRDVAGQTGGDQGFLSDFATGPDLGANFIVTYARGDWSLTTQARYVSDGILDKQTPKKGPEDAGYNPGLTGSVTSNRVPSYLLWNLAGSYNFKAFERMQMFASINNVADKEPPFSAGGVGGANAVFFDALGRTYRVGIRMQF